MTINKNSIDKKLNYIQTYLGWAISILTAILGIIFFALAANNITAYLYGIFCLLIALAACPQTPFPAWIKALIAFVSLLVIG
ncbi:MAG: hypothetical protein QNJ38_22200 [Prochloraceae cyanobacterium]|nr:hypothetical protein [Prochloraceae cyanobacterium]